MRRSPPARSDVLQLKVTLDNFEPPILRRFLIRANAKLSKLHQVLQEVMGWEDYHLHQFEIGRWKKYGPPEAESGENETDESTVALCDVVREGMRFRYRYDFGDSWSHTIEVERAVRPEKGRRYPVCVEGARACPPEDCGGVYGYEDFLAAVMDPNNERHEELLDWIGDEPWDPELFDLEHVNRRLKRLPSASLTEDVIEL